MAENEEPQPAALEAPPPPAAPPEKPKKEKPKKEKAAKDKSKDKPKGKDKGKGKKGKGGEPVAGSSVATHPRARGSVRRVKGWAGIGGFLAAAALSVQASVPLFQVGVRALAAGVVAYMLAWWFSVVIWRHLIIAEQRAAIAELERRRAENGDQPKAEAQPTVG